MRVICYPSLTPKTHRGMQERAQGQCAMKKTNELTEISLGLYAHLQSIADAIAVRGATTGALLIHYSSMLSIQHFTTCLELAGIKSEYIPQVVEWTRARRADKIQQNIQVLFHPAKPKAQPTTPLQPDLTNFTDMSPQGIPVPLHIIISMLSKATESVEEWACSVDTCKGIAFTIWMLYSHLSGNLQFDFSQHVRSELEVRGIHDSQALTHKFPVMGSDITFNALQWIVLHAAGHPAPSGVDYEHDAAPVPEPAEFDWSNLEFDS